MFKRILVCLDGSKLAEQILPYATEQAKCFNSKLVLLRAYAVPGYVAKAQAVAAIVGGPDIIDEENQRLENEAKTYLEKLARQLREEGLDVMCVALHGSPGEVIVSSAQDVGIDLVCIATHGQSGLGKIVFGSVADHVLKKSGLPILLIKPS
jgi:nucleotide-binding universal stress UspA family protein